MERSVSVRRWGWCALLAAGLGALAWSASGAPDPAGASAAGSGGSGGRGPAIYEARCVKCHGPQGEGVAGKADEALSGTKTVEQLTKVIQETMPEDRPGSLKGDEAARVAAYVHGAFYSPEARARMRPARVELSRLTVAQHRATVADLVGSFRGAYPHVGKDERGGLRAQYFDGKRFGRNAALERTDPVVDFAFGAASPVPDKVKPEEFAIRWRGSVVAEETGEHEFVLETEIGARLWVNGPTGEKSALVDAWVASGAEPRQHRASVFLLAGRAYPIQLDVFKQKDKSASVKLMWRPPHGALEVIPARSLSPKRVPETLVVATPFPADDASVGYERGTSVSKAWYAAATSAAIEVAGKVVERLDELAGTRADAKDREKKVKAFCAAFAERAFRRPLTDAQRASFVDAMFEGAGDLEAGARRSIVLILKSPRFLYPDLAGAGAGGRPADAYDVAARLALTLWDSLPDKALLDAAAAGKLATAEQVRQQARRMLDDPRARTKVREFLHHWLEFDRAEDLAKDTRAYPDFDEAVAADMRTSLDLFLDAVVWEGRGDYRELLLADWMPLNARLARFFGLPAPKGDPAAFERYAFDPKQRSGVLTHPFLLTALAYHRNSSPIHRGVFLTRNVVGRALKPPPMAIEFMDDRFDASLTMREKVTQLTRSDACMGCHATINPLGFALEHYDAVGRYRTIDNGKPVDASGEYEAADGKVIRLRGPRDVAEHAAASPEAHRAFVTQLFNHLAKQAPAAYGPATADELTAAFAASDFDVRKLVVEAARVAAMRSVSPVGSASADAGDRRVR